MVNFVALKKTEGPVQERAEPKFTGLNRSKTQDGSDNLEPNTEPHPSLQRRTEDHVTAMDFKVQCLI